MGRKVGILVLRNKFHFSEVHRSMNATGHVQSKWRPKGAMLTVHATRWVNTSMNLRKMKFISYIYTLFLHRFVHNLWNIDLTLANKRRRKVLIRRVWLIRSTAVTMTRLNRTLRRPIIRCIYIWRRLSVTSHERVPFMGVWSSSVLNRFI